MTKLAWATDGHGALHPDEYARFKFLLDQWARTPYKLYSQRRGVKGGVDCVRFITGVADSLLGIRTQVPKVISDVSLHSRITANHSMRWMMREYDMRRVDAAEALQPMDVIVAGPPGGGPGHGILCGPDRFLYHVTCSQGVVRTGLGLAFLDFHHVLRRQQPWQPQQQSA